MTTLIVLYFSKTNFDNIETRTYSKLLWINFSFIVIGVFTYIMAVTTANFTVIGFLQKIYMSTLTILNLYSMIYCISIYDKEDKYELLKKILFVVTGISILLIIVLPLNVILEGDLLDGEGLSYDVAIAHTVLSFIFFLLTTINFISKKHSIKKLFPFIILIVLYILGFLIRNYFKELIFEGFFYAYILLIMFNTIENPDVKMVEELTKAKRLSESANNEKSNFIYAITNDINNRLNDADKVYNNIKASKSFEETLYYIDDLKEIISSARMKLNQTIDISQMDIKHLNITNNKYDIRVLLDSVYTLVTQDINENIEFRLNVSEEIPNKLYGDSIKLKQILISLLNNSIKYTEKGFIELRVNSIIKNDICRLIITVEDSGKGIDIYKQNEIMSNHNELSDNDIDELEGNNVNLKVIRKMVSVIGGTFTIDTNKFNGTTITISLDQKVLYKDKSKEEKQIDEYSEEFKSQKKCAIVTLNKEDAKQIKAIYKKDNYRVFEFDGTKKLLDLLRNNEQYDVIYIDEYMEKIDARNFISKIKSIDNFNSKLYVISENKDIKTRKELLTSGFAGVVYSPVIKKDIILNNQKSEYN